MPLGASSLVLAALALQNSAHVLLVSYTRQRTVPLYFVSVIIALGEALKLAINGLLLCMLEPDLAASLRELRGLSRRQILAYAVPALLYTIGSNVTYIGAANLPAAAYQVTNQLRIPMTAALSRALLQKRISRVQIVAVCLLLLGVTLVLLKPDHASADAPVGALRQRNTVVGVTAVLITCLCSTFASVWFEKVLKHGVSTDVPPLSLWSSNILLAGLSLPLAWATAAVQDGPGLVARGLFYGFDPLVIFVLTSHVTGGLLVSLTLKYADNVLKTFATAAALVLSCIGSYLLFGATLSDVFLLGVALVFSSTLLYSLGLPLRCVSGRASVPRRFTKLSSERERDDGCDTDLPIAAEAGTEEGQGARVAPLGDQAHGCRKPHASS